MAPHEGDEDPAVYQSGSSKKDKVLETNGSSTPNGDTSPGSQDDGDADMGENDAADGEDEEEEEEDGTLLTVQPGFNRLILALRDEGVMRFTKYVSAAAPGSVWNVCGEYEVHMTEETDDDASGTGGSSRSKSAD